MKIGQSHIRFDEMTWPRCGGFLSQINDRARYAELSREQILFLASVASAYHALVFSTQKKRNRVCKVLKYAEAIGKVKQ